MKLKIRLVSFLLITLIVIQSSCTALVGGSIAVAAAAAITMQQDRSLGSIVDDTTILMRINSGLLKHRLFSAIKVIVSEGRVLLIGNVDTLEKQLKAEKIAWQQNEIKEVINEIRVTPIQTSSMIDVTTDSLITAEIRTKLLAKRNIKSINYSVNTLNKVVYLIGIAQDKAELGSVVEVARRVKGVKQVVSYVRYRNSRLHY